MIALLIFAVLVPVVITLYVVAHHTRYGHLRVSELPGCVLILLAGEPSRARLAGILARRAHPHPGSLWTHSLERELGIVPPSALEARVEELGKVMQAGSWSMGDAQPARPHMTACTCNMCGYGTQDRERCGPCERQWKAGRPL